MKRLGFLFLISIISLGTFAQQPRVAKPSDIGHDVTTLPRAGFLRPDWDGTNLKFITSGGVLKTLAELVGPISTSAISTTFTQAVADGRYRPSATQINWNTDLANKPTDVGAFGNSVGYQTSQQVSQAITNALANRLTQSQTDLLYRKVTDTQAANTISNFNSAVRSAITVSGTGATYNSATGELVMSAPATNDSLFVISGSGVATVTKYLASRSTSTTFVLGSTASAASADSTIGRINLAAMTSVTVTSAQQFQDLLNSSITNKNIVIAAALNAASTNETFGFNAKGNWSNVRLSLLNSSCGLYNSSWTQALVFVSNTTVSQIQLDGLRLWTTYTGTGSTDPVLRSNELVSLNGFEVKNCEIWSTSPSNHNLVTLQQYSTSSHQGAVSQNIFFHDNNFHDGPRMAVEITSQGYDGVTRFKNVTYLRNKHNYLGKVDIYGMASSFSGDIDGVYHANNTSIEAEKVAYEFVNTRNVYAYNNSATSTTNVCAGYGISDDAHKLTYNLHIVGGTFNMSERGFYVYDTQNVTIDGGTYTSRRGNETNSNNSVFRGITMNNINGAYPDASFNVKDAAHGNLFDGLIISSAGTRAAGGQGPYETLVLRPNTYNNTVKNMNTTIGKQSDGSYFNSGAVVNQGTASPTNNILTNTNTFQQAAN